MPRGCSVGTLHGSVPDDAHKVVVRGADKEDKAA